MGFYSILIVTVLYLATCCDLWWKRDLPHSLVYLGYAAANVGWLWYLYDH